ncbi:hypothetical protein IFM46972_03586 [Aspergillus udagawae]|uniref:Uncharacterized protein n=1 Tax=Aspergillus udagawae TaxID=91492 RepID=A0A8H3RP86_9EURO|nr:hypothetical protein IFM46972_03586 [Aspergillus udagawae]
MKSGSYSMASQRNLHFLQSHVEPYAATRPRRKRHIHAPVPIPDSLGHPSVRVEPIRVIPVCRVPVKVRDARNEDGPLRQRPSAGENDVFLSVAGRLEGWAVHALCLLDKGVEEQHSLDLIVAPLLVEGGTVVDQLLEETVLLP